MMGGFFRGFGTGKGVKEEVGHRKKIVFGKEGYGQGEEMAYGVTNAGPLMRAFMANASGPAGLYQGNKRIPYLKLIRFFRCEVKQLFCHRKNSVFIDYFINPLCRNA